MPEKEGVFVKMAKMASGIRSCPQGYRGRMAMQKMGLSCYECLCPDGVARQCTSYNEEDMLCEPEGFAKLPVL